MDLSDAPFGQVSGEPMVVKTLLGQSDLECSVNETLAPAPWASKISAARGASGAASSLDT